MTRDSKHSGDVLRKADYVLAIDASTEICSVAIHTPQGLHSRVSREARAHAQSLLPMIDDALAEANITLSRLDYCALVNGPGSFTGIRIAMSVIQGLAYGAKLPVVCASSLEVMAYDCTKRLKPTANSLIVTALDARMSEVYWAAFLVSENGELSEHASATVSSFDVLGDYLKRINERKSVIKAGAVFLSDYAASMPKLVVDADCEPNAEALIGALSQLQKPKLNVETIEPLYLRNEIAWKKRTRIRSESI